MPNENISRIKIHIKIPPANSQEGSLPKECLNMMYMFQYKNFGACILYFDGFSFKNNSRIFLHLASSTNRAQRSSIALLTFTTLRRFFLNQRRKI